MIMGNVGRKKKKEWQQKRMGWKNKDRRKGLQEKMTTGKEGKDHKNDNRKGGLQEWMTAEMEEKDHKKKNDTE